MSVKKFLHVQCSIRRIKHLKRYSHIILLIFLQHIAILLVADKLANLLLVQFRIFFDEPDDLFRIQGQRQQLVFLQVCDALKWFHIKLLSTRLINLQYNEQKIQSLSITQTEI